MDYTGKTLAVTGVALPLVLGAWTVGLILILGVITLAVIDNRARRIK